MIARIHILLPFAITVPEKTSYSIYEYEVDGYRIKIFPPERSERADSYTDAESTTIDETAAFNADVLRIDFLKGEFDRKENSDFDPPLELIKKVANDFLARLRYVANASKI